MSADGGRPEFQPTKEQRFAVQVATACGARQESIAAQLGIDRKTLRKHFRHELKHGKLDANAAMGQSLFKKGLGNGTGSVAAAIFWLKTQAGWKETSRHELTGENGKPLNPPPPASVTAEQFREIARELISEV